MFARRLFIVLLVLTSLALNESKAYPRQPIEKSTSSKARYYPLARDYRQKIQEKIEAPFLICTDLQTLNSALPSRRPTFREVDREGDFISSQKPVELLMSLQP
jgi:hypothetical protein